MWNYKELHWIHESLFKGDFSLNLALKPLFSIKECIYHNFIYVMYIYHVFISLPSSTIMMEDSTCEALVFICVEPTSCMTPPSKIFK